MQRLSARTTEVEIDDDPDVIDGIEYPSSDGKPMGETGWQVLAIFHLYEVLRRRYEMRNDVYIAADMFWYWELGNPKACTAPDLMVNFGVRHNRERRSFKTWIENRVIPSVTFEMASKNTWRKNMGKTKDIYERLGVKEYFLFDPEEKYLPEHLLGFRLVKKRYVRIPRIGDGMSSRELGLRLIPQGRLLRVADPATGEIILTDRERANIQTELLMEEHRRAEDEKRRAEDEKRRAEDEKRRAEDEKRRAEEEKRRAEEEKRRAEEEKRRADSFEEEVNRLRTQLSQQKNGTNGTNRGKPSS